MRLRPLKWAEPLIAVTPLMPIYKNPYAPLPVSVLFEDIPVMLISAPHAEKKTPTKT